MTLNSQTASMSLLPEDSEHVAVVAKFFRALGDPTRLRLPEFLLHDEHSVSDLRRRGRAGPGPGLDPLANCPRIDPTPTKTVTR
ncbi:hypothetical protein SAMN05216266_12065 [Amycolatopsis marina]|uniref:Uncharacterized protein n=1 Tax=Amycolatopsis marina TaxID=490629 RepID=A0A1I1C7J4_9PSEU|nr:hypothetical protein [Amycolatopsis marina]SFB56848.1 hypothetical protein SAMN05216266_12065 [Amycolatopsis marina]